MADLLREQTIALAGVFQAAELVRQIAHRGQADPEDSETCLSSVLTTDIESAEALYGGTSGVRTGLRVLADGLGQQRTSGAHAEVIRYVVALTHLERKLVRDRALMDRIARGIEQAQNQSRHFGITHENVIANLAGIYSDTLSQLKPRILVTGDPQILSSKPHADRVRALLLSGIRAAVLWRQRGGRRWHFLFRRGSLTQQALELLRGA